MASTYRIADEPAPNQLASFAVNPMWPLLAMMLGGLWISLPWFIFNAFAVGSPTRNRELVITVFGVIGCACLTFGILYLAKINFLTEKAQFQYAMLIIVLWKLMLAYVLYTLQSRTIYIFEYYGGALRNGLIPLIGSLFAGPIVVNAIAPGTFFKIILG